MSKIECERPDLSNVVHDPRFHDRMMKSYDRKGVEICFCEWNEIKRWEHENKDRCYTTLAYESMDECDVSTVWLGNDHQFGDGPPLIFETMIFAADEDSELSEWQNRYSTEEEAFEGHKKVVEAVKNGTDPSKAFD